MRQKDLERQLKERAKLSALEQARLEVEAHKNALEVLLSVHKDRSAPVEWARFACSLPPHEPPTPGRHEFAAVLKNDVTSPENAAGSESAEVEAARVLDEREQQTAREDYAKRLAEWQHMHALANGVLSGEPGAYSQAITEFSSLAEVSGIGSSLHVTIHSPKLIGCGLTVNGREAIPADEKSLTAAGKVSVKTMPESATFSGSHAASPAAIHAAAPSKPSRCVSRQTNGA